ncbi:unnamed protein product, partial [Staurois parvus]
SKLAARSTVISSVPVRPSHCCCLHRHTLPCATFRSPHTLLVCYIFCHRVAGRLRAFTHCCCQAPNLPWAPCTASSCCCQVQSLSHRVPVPASHCCCLPSPHSAMCHFQVSSHTAGVCYIFC